MTSQRSDFLDYQPLREHLWVHGISAHAVGVGSVRLHVTAMDGTVLPATLRNVLHVPELSRRASWAYHRLFSLTQARQQGHRVILSDRSGVNEYMVRVLCELDMVDVVVPLLLRGMAVSKFDIADAFLVWPVYARDCEVQGFQHPATGEYYRYRFMPFGLKQAPGVQQRWARFVLDVVRRLGLRYCRPTSPEGSLGNLRALGGYLDDFGVGHHPCLTPWQQHLQYWSILCVLQDLGIPVKHAKNAWPSTLCEWTGLELDTVQGVLRLSTKRCAKLLTRLEDSIDLNGYGYHENGCQTGIERVQYPWKSQSERVPGTGTRRYGRLPDITVYGY